MASYPTSSKPRICLVALIGLPGTGKTTLCNQLQTFITEESMPEFGCLHLCYDQLIPISKQKDMALEASNHSDESSSKQKINDNFKSSRKNIIQISEHVIYKLKGIVEKGDDYVQTNDGNILQSYESVKEKENIIMLLDDNNYYQSMRYEYYQLARKHSIGFCEIYLNPDCIDSVLSNNQLRPIAEQIPDDVIKAMGTKIEAPDPFKNPWEQFSFSINVQEKQNEKCQSLYNMEISRVQYNIVKLFCDIKLEVSLPTQ